MERCNVTGADFTNRSLLLPDNVLKRMVTGFIMQPSGAECRDYGLQVLSSSGGLCGGMLWAKGALSKPVPDNVLAK